MSSRKFIYTENKVTNTLVDGYYIWLGFLGTSNVCHILKNSAFDPSQNYFTLSINADEITNFWKDTTYLYATLDDSTNVACRINKTNPISSQAYFAKPITIIERAVDIITDNTYAYILIPGDASGTNAKVLKMSISLRTLITTIDLSSIINARKIDIDSSGNLWVVTDTTPPKLIKIQYISGSYSFTTYTLI